RAEPRSSPRPGATGRGGGGRARGASAAKSCLGDRLGGGLPGGDARQGRAGGRVPDARGASPRRTRPPDRPLPPAEADPWAHAVTMRRTEPRFVLPRAVRRATVLGGLRSWELGLEQAGIETGDRPELVVAPAALAREAMALGSEFVILEGRAGARALRGGGWSTSS